MKQSKDPERRSSFGFLSSFGRGNNNKTDTDDIKSDSEEDPVMALFRSRTTQRVRFALEGGGGSTSQQDHDPSTATSSSVSSRSEGSTPQPGISKFMKGALFGNTTYNNKTKSDEEDEFDSVVAKEIEQAKLSQTEMVWESSDAGAEMVRTQSSEKRDITLSFVEHTETRARVIKLLNKATRAQAVHFRYAYAVKCCMKGKSRRSAKQNRAYKEHRKPLSTHSFVISLSQRWNCWIKRSTLMIIQLWLRLFNRSIMPITL